MALWPINCKHSGASYTVNVLPGTGWGQHLYATDLNMQPESSNPYILAVDQKHLWALAVSMALYARTGERVAFGWE